MIQFNLNGQAVEFELDGPSPLINVLRDHFGLFGTRFGCGQESCGACIVLIDGKPSYSCSVGVDEIASRSVQTVEGLGIPENPHPLQKAFLAEQAGQCGFCLSGHYSKTTYARTTILYNEQCSISKTFRNQNFSQHMCTFSCRR